MKAVLIVLLLATTALAAPKAPAPTVTYRYVHRASAGTVYRVTATDHRGRIVERHTLVVLKHNRGYLFDGKKVRSR